KVQKSVVMLAGDQSHVAAAAAVAAAWSAARNELLAPERKTPVATVAGLHQNSYFIDEQLLFGGLDTDELPLASTIAEVNHAGDFREQRVVLAETDVLAGFDASAALANDNRSAGDQLAAKGLHAQPLRVGIAPVFRTAKTFFMCHNNL